MSPKSKTILKHTRSNINDLYFYHWDGQAESSMLQYGAFTRNRTEFSGLQNPCITIYALKANLDICPNSRRYRWLPTQEYALRNLAQKLQFLNSKSNREGRSTHTVIIPYKSQQVNFKNSLQISNLKKIAVFGAGGKIHRHLGISNPTSRR